jgi:hypothetical protein
MISKYNKKRFFFIFMMFFYQYFLLFINKNYYILISIVGCDYLYEVKKSGLGGGGITEFHAIENSVLFKIILDLCIVFFIGRIVNFKNHTFCIFF